MGDPRGVGGFKGGGGGGRSPILSKSSKKSVEKISKIGKIGKNRFFFFHENGLKCIRNPTKHL